MRYGHARQGSSIFQASKIRDNLYMDVNNTVTTTCSLDSITTFSDRDKKLHFLKSGQVYIFPLYYFVVILCIFKAELTEM